jgi:hypothetical protein
MDTAAAGPQARGADRLREGAPRALGSCADRLDVCLKRLTGEKGGRGCDGFVSEDDATGTAVELPSR